MQLEDPDSMTTRSAQRRPLPHYLTASGCRRRRLFTMISLVCAFGVDPGFRAAILRFPSLQSAIEIQPLQYSLANAPGPEHGSHLASSAQQ